MILIAGWINTSLTPMIRRQTDWKTEKFSLNLWSVQLLSQIQEKMPSMNSDISELRSELPGAIHLVVVIETTDVYDTQGENIK